MMRFLTVIYIFHKCVSLSKDTSFWILVIFKRCHFLQLKLGHNIKIFKKFYVNSLSMLYMKAAQMAIIFLRIFDENNKKILKEQRPTRHPYIGCGEFNDSMGYPSL